MASLHWSAAVARLREQRRPGVLVTLCEVRGHAPREAGAKMVVSREEIFGSVGGGNLEETAVARARELLATGAVAPETLAVSLSDRARTEHGRQCCGGEVTLLLEPLAVAPAVAIFGLGHVGAELARILSRHDLELHLVDSRATYVEEAAALAEHSDGPASVHTHHAPVPELVLSLLPAGTRVFVMTHDHAEDFALCDEALRSTSLGPISLIGSAAKWSRFERALHAQGHDGAAIARITCPIDGDGMPGKEPAVIALGAATALLRTVIAERSAIR